MSGGSPPVHCVHVAKLTIMHCKDTLRRGGVHIIHAQVCVCVHLCVYVCVCLCMVIYCIYYDRSDYMIVLCTHVYTNIILPITTSKPAKMRAETHLIQKLTNTLVTLHTFSSSFLV